MPAVEHSSRPRSGEPSRKNRRPLAITVAALLFLLALIWSATLWDISRKFKGLTVEKLKSLNNLKSNQVSPGMKLILG